MQKNIFPSLLAVIFLMLLAIPTQASAQEMDDYYFPVGEFTTLKIQDNVNVVYHCSQDSVAHVSYHSEPDFADAFIFTNSGETLKIQVTTEDVGKPGLPTIHVYSRFLTKIENYSDFNAQVIDPAPAPQFTASLIGNGSISVSGLNATKVTARITAGMGTIILSGKCTDAEYRMMGTGNIDADTMKAENVVCKILGGGTISCSPLKYLKVHGIGSTRVFYTGTPTIKHSGGGKLIKAD